MCAVKFCYFLCKEERNSKVSPCIVKTNSVHTFGQFLQFSFLPFIAVVIYNSPSDFLQNIELIFRKIHNGKLVKIALFFSLKTGLVLRASIMKIPISVRKLRALAPF